MLKWINKKRNQKGFTLIELVVVIAILGILAAIAIPRLSGARFNANKKAVESSLRAIDSAITLAEAENQPVTNLQSLVNSGFLASLPKNPDGGTFSVEPYETTYIVVEDGNNVTKTLSTNRAVMTMVTPNKFGLAVGVTGKGTVEELSTKFSGW